MSNFVNWLKIRQEGQSFLLDLRQEHLNLFGIVHLAILIALGEWAAIKEVSSLGIALDQLMPMKVDSSFFRPATMEPSPTVSAQGKIISRTRSIVVADGEVFQGDKLVARITVTIFIRPTPT